MIYPSYNTSLHFYLDGSSDPAGSYQRLAHPPASPLYNEPVFQTDDLEDGPHTVLMNAPDSTLFAFDFAVYWHAVSSLPVRRADMAAGRAGLPGVIPVFTVAPDPSSKTSSSTGGQGATSRQPSGTGDLPGGSSATPRQPSSTTRNLSGPESSVTPTRTATALRRSHAGELNLAVALGISIPGIAVILTLALWYTWRRRRRTRAGEISQQQPDGGDADDDAIVPFYAVPDATQSAPAVKDAKLLAGDEAVLGAANEESQAQGAADPASPPAPAAMALTRLEAELARMHAQYELLRRAAEPPPYSDGSRVSRGLRLFNRDAY